MVSIFAQGVYARGRPRSRRGTPLPVQLVGAWDSTCATECGATSLPDRAACKRHANNGRTRPIGLSQSCDRDWHEYNHGCVESGQYMCQSMGVGQVCPIHAGFTGLPALRVLFDK